MNQTTAARVAAYIDGEGCLSRKKWSRKDGALVVIPTVSIRNTSIKLIEWFQGRFGGYVSRADQDPRWKIAYQWVLEGLGARDLVREIARWFLIKVEQVRWFVRYKLPQKKPKDYIYNWRISERIRKLNKRGR